MQIVSIGKRGGKASLFTGGAVLGLVRVADGVNEFPGVWLELPRDERHGDKKFCVVFSLDEARRLCSALPGFLDAAAKSSALTFGGSLAGARKVEVGEVGHTSVSGGQRAEVQTRDGLVIGHMRRASMPGDMGDLYSVDLVASDAGPSKAIGGASSAARAVAMLVEAWNERLDKFAASGVRS